jgi:hypothetical protein
LVPAAIAHTAIWGKGAAPVWACFARDSKVSRQCLRRRGALCQRSVKIVAIVENTASLRGFKRIKDAAHVDDLHR